MWRWTLIGISIFNVVSCILGFYYLVIAGAPGMPFDEVMRPSIFTSFVIPGWILLVVVGGTQLAALITLWKRRASAAFWSGVAGFGMVIWIYVEVVLMTGTGILHHIYLAAGLAQLGFTLALLGIFDRRAAAAVERPDR
ncbi:hypothetical protein [Gulosibacter molinativorax]|nr:hypothetical protein [Gulosibacter molinativorax]QUY63252.1 Hypothetical protein GMOLON4_2568 [Gulosibacter molinativorax]